MNKRSPSRKSHIREQQDKEYPVVTEAKIGIWLRTRDHSRTDKVSTRDLGLPLSTPVESTISSFLYLCYLSLFGLGECSVYAC